MLLMLFGIATRVRIGDKFAQILPAATLFLVNLFIAVSTSDSLLPFVKVNSWLLAFLNQ